MEELIKDLEGLCKHLGESSVSANLICNKIRKHRVKNRVEFTGFECVRIIDLTKRSVDYDSLMVALTGPLSISELVKYYPNLCDLTIEEMEIMKKSVDFNSREMIRIITSYLYGKTYLNEDMIEFYMGEFFSLIDYKARLGLPITNMESDLVSEFYSKYKEFTR